MPLGVIQPEHEMRNATDFEKGPEHPQRPAIGRDIPHAIEAISENRTDMMLDENLIQPADEAAGVGLVDRPDFVKFQNNVIDLKLADAPQDAVEIIARSASG